MLKTLSFLSTKESEVVGIDEVGYGAIAGPLITCVLYIPWIHNTKFLSIRDSKQLTEKNRNIWYNIITKYCFYSIGIASNNEIDKINIRNATVLACQRAVNNFSYKANKYFVDGNLKFNSQKYVSIVKGDEKFIEIAAASVIAKVTRDQIMILYSKKEKYSKYKWLSNKGYCTAQHISKLKIFGPTNLHRKTFIKNILKS